MNEMNEALRLAEYHECAMDLHSIQTAAELRRLHAENEALRRERDEARRTVREAHEAGTRLTAQRDALLEALKRAADFLHHATEFRLGHPGFEQTHAKARAAIKAAEEGK